MSFGKKYIIEDTNELGRGTQIGGRRYNNPYFDNKPKPNYRKMVKIWLIIIIFCLILAIFFTIPFFKIGSVKIVGEGRIANEKILDLIVGQEDKKIFHLLSQSNIFLFKSTELIHELRTNYNFLTIEVQKKFPNKLIVNIKQRDPVYIVNEDSVNYLIDKEGFIITREVTLNDETNFTRIDISGKKSDANKFEINDLHLEQITGLIESVKSKLTLNIEKISIGTDPDTIEFKIKDGPKIYFSSAKKIESQIEKLVVIHDTLKDIFFKKEYVDLRIDENIYIK